MPAKTEKHRRAMYAAAEGNSTLGIPASVGKEFITTDSRIRGVGICLVTPQGEALFIKRSPDANHPETYDFPGGKADDNETPEQTARRETLEEIGAAPYGDLALMSHEADSDGVEFITYRLQVMRKFTPKLDLSEHTEFVWAPLTNPPQPLHPGVAKTINDTLAQDYVIFGEGAAKEYAGHVANSKVTNETVENTKVSGSAPNQKRNSGAEDSCLAFDRASVRMTDVDGRMHIALTNISKAVVNPYYGSEIPGYEELGLEPTRVYQLLRHPDELAKAAASSNNIQLLEVHEPVHASDPKRELTIGSTGTDGVFNTPYLQNSLVIWEASAIERIESNETCELSCGYRYRPDMTPGEYETVPYHGVMRDIVMNHVALVKKGRAGPDVVVADGSITLNGENQMSKSLSKKATLVKGVLLAVLKPKIAADKMPDFDTILADVTKKNWLDKKASIAVALAADADVADLLDSLDDKAPSDAEDADPVEDLLAMVRGKLSDEDIAAFEEKLRAALPAAVAADEPPAFEGKPEVGAGPAEKKDGMVSKPAMDSAIKAGVDAAVARVEATHAARKAVAPYVGELAIACDSAEAVYRHALTNMGVDVKGVHASAFPAILAAQPLPGAATRRVVHAADSAQVSALAEFKKANGLI